MRSAKAESFLKLLHLRVTQAKPADDAALHDCLKIVFENGSVKARKALLGLTDNSRLRFIWLNSCTEELIADVALHYKNSELLDIIDLCSREAKEEIYKRLKDNEKQV